MSAVEKGHVLTHFTFNLMLHSMSQTLQQEKHVLQRKLDMNELASGQREAELAADLAALRAELERHHSQGRDRRRDESEQLNQLANHNQRLVEQLAEVSVCCHQTDSQNPAFKKTSQLCHNAVWTNKILVYMCVRVWVWEVSACVCVVSQLHKQEKCRPAGWGSLGHPCSLTWTIDTFLNLSVSSSRLLHWNTPWGRSSARSEKRWRSRLLAETSTSHN